MSPEDIANDIFEYDAPGERTKGTFTVRTVTGDELEIQSKEPMGNGRLKMIDADGGEWVNHPTVSGMVERYDPELHDAGTPATGKAAEGWSESADATDAADAKADLAANLPKDATDAADAEAALNEELAQTKGDRPLPAPQPSTDEEPPPAA